MSRSRHIQAAPAPEPPAARRWGAALADRSGALRGGWLLALAAPAWAAVSLGARLGLTAGFGALFSAWGIDANNARLAPAWARLVYGWHGSAITAAQALAVIALALGLRRLFRVESPAGDRVLSGARAALVAVLAALLPAALYLLADSLRLEWPLSRPRVSAGLPALLCISLLSALAEELFTKRLLFDALRPRWGAAWTSVAVTLVFFVAAGGYAGSAVSAVNVLLMGALCCCLYARTGSLWAVTGLRWGWSAANLFLLGFGGGGSALYRLYAVSETALTGGDAGLIYGLGATLELLAGLAWLLRAKIAALARGLRGRKRA